MSSVISTIGPQIVASFLAITDPFDISGSVVRYAMGEDELPADLESGVPVLTIWMATPVSERDTVVESSMLVDVQVGLSYYLLNEDNRASDSTGFASRQDAAAACRRAVVEHQYRVQRGDYVGGYLEPGSMQQTIGAISQVERGKYSVSTRFRLRFDEYWAPVVEPEENNP